MTVLRRIRPMYRCRCFVRFAVVIVTALLCGLEVVKYKNRPKTTGLPSPGRNAFHHPATVMEPHQDQLHEVEKTQISFSEGLIQDYGGDSLENEDDSFINFDTRIDKGNGGTLIEAEGKQEAIEIKKGNSNKRLNRIQENHNERMVVQEQKDGYKETEKHIKEHVKNKMQNVGGKMWTITKNDKAVAKNAKKKKLMKRDYDGITFAVEQGDSNQETEKNHEEGKKLPARGEIRLKEDKEHAREATEEKTVGILESDINDDHTENGGEKAIEIKTENHSTVESEDLKQKKQGIEKQRTVQAHVGDSLFEIKDIGVATQQRENNNGMTIESHLKEKLIKSTAIYVQQQVKKTEKNPEESAVKRANATLGGSVRSSEKNLKEPKIVMKKQNGTNQNNLEREKRKVDEREIKHIYGANTEARRNYTRRTYKDKVGKKAKNETEEARSKQGGIEIGESNARRVKTFVSKFIYEKTESLKERGNDKENNNTSKKGGNIVKGTKWEKPRRRIIVESPTQNNIDQDCMDGSQGRREQAMKQKVSEEVLRRRQEKRIKMVNTFCQRSPRDKNLPPKREMNYLVVLDEPRIIYCSVPKVASTEWREALSFYHNYARVQGKQAQNRTLWKHLSEYSSRNVTAKIQQYFKFLFVREPFERLLSAYTSKFLVKNEVYHRKFGREIIKKFRKNATEQQKKSGDGVTFFEFVKYVAFAKAHDEHWRPYNQLCHVCSIGYNFIGYLETIDEDAPFLIKESKMDGHVAFKSNRRSHTSSDLLRFYSQIPLRYIYRLRSIYFNDFEMFGYPFPGPLKSLINSQLEEPVGA